MARKHTDEDGIDGPFDRAMRKALREDAKMFDEEPTVVIPRITTRELIALDPDGHYARAKGAA